MEKVILLADKNSSSWGFAEKIQNYIQTSKETKVSLRGVSMNRFRNGEEDIHVPENIRGKDVYFIHDSSKNPAEWWVQLILLKDLLLSASAESVSFVLPNMPYSRKDRKEKPHVPISARALANTISPNLKRIITMDLHAPQIQGFYPENVPLDNLYSFPDAVRYIRENTGQMENLENLVIISPDAGGVERARSFAQKLGSIYPIAFIEKRRIRAGEIEEMRIVGEVKDKDVLLVDDIIDSGGTLCKAAELLKSEGAKSLMCYGTHGLFTKGTKEITSCFDRVMTSNTYPQTDSSVEVIDVSSTFAEAIYRAQKDLSISKLFE